MTTIRETTTYLEFSAGQAAEVSGVNAPLQRHWRQRGLLPDNEPGKHARFLPGEVLRMTIMKAFSDSNISIKGARVFTQTAANVASAILQTLPGAVEIVTDASLGAEFVARERSRLEVWRDARMKSRYLFMPLPEREDRPGSIAMYQRAALTDLHTLLDEHSFHGLLIDADAIARAFLAHVRRVTILPLETRRFTVEPDSNEGAE